MEIVLSPELVSTTESPMFTVEHTTRIFPFPAPRPKVSLVIPTKNEVKNLPHVLPRIPAMVDEIILVDANSTDGTVEMARQLCPDIRVVAQPGRGKGNALRAGFAAATGDIIVMIDADGSMAPEEIPAFVGLLLAGADYAKGSRFLHGGGTDDMEFHRYLGNVGLNLLVRILFGGHYSDLCYGYCAFWSRTLPVLNLVSDGFEIETEINVKALKAGIQVAEVPSYEAERIHGHSNLNAIRDGLRVLRVILSERLAGRSNANKLKRSIAPDEFTPAMALLHLEAMYLARRRDQIARAYYESATEAIKAASTTLLKMESSNPHVKRQQEIYRLRGESMWSFLDRQSTHTA